MRETGFIEQNAEKWAHFEKILQQEKKDPEELSRLFIEITDDLSYARTFYPNRSVRVYLNNLAQKVFYNLYRNKREKTNRFFLFWLEELPLLVYQSRQAFLLSFLIFSLAVGIGVLSSAQDPEFPRVVLGDAYVDATLGNIEKGDPMAIYKQGKEMDVFMGITLNNLMVAFRTFILGVLFAVGTAGILLYNGIMIGSFQFFFYDQGLFRESFLTIWMHGTLEISAIIIAGAAGLTLGKGLLFPGSFSRMQAFRLSARQGLKIMLGVTPVFILAAFIEGFLTRYTAAHDLLQLAVIGSSLLFVLTYFVWYPWRISQRKVPAQLNLSAPVSAPIDLNTIKTTGELFADTFKLYRIHFGWLLSFALGSALVHGMVLAFMLFSGALEAIDLQGFERLSFFRLFDFQHSPVLFLLNIVSTSALAVIVFALVKHADTPLTFVKSLAGTIKGMIPRTYWPLGIFLVYHLLFLVLEPWPAIIMAGITFPIAALWIYHQLQRQRSFDSANPFIWIQGSWFRLTGLYVLLLVFCILYFVLLKSPLFYGYFEILQWNLPLDPDMVNLLFTFFMAFSFMGLWYLVLPLMFIGMGLCYHTLVEVKSAVWLKQEIDHFGENSRHEV